MIINIVTSCAFLLIHHVIPHTSPSSMSSGCCCNTFCFNRHFRVPLDSFHSALGAKCNFANMRLTHLKTKTLPSHHEDVQDVHSEANGILHVIASIQFNSFIMLTALVYINHHPLLKQKPCIHLLSCQSPITIQADETSSMCRFHLNEIWTISC